MPRGRARLRRAGTARHAQTVRGSRNHAGQYSSTAQDLARQKKTEIDHLNGFVVRKGEALGVRTPVNRVLLALVQSLESKS